MVPDISSYRLSGCLYDLPSRRSPINFVLAKKLKMQTSRPTGMRSGYFCRIRSASALRFSTNPKNLNKGNNIRGGSLTKRVLILELGSHFVSNLPREVNTTRDSELRWWWFGVKHTTKLNNTRSPASHWESTRNNKDLTQHFQNQGHSDFPLTNLTTTSNK